MQQSLFYCQTHSEEQITNFCCLKNCYQPLCPDCIDNHIKNHKQNGQVPEVDIISRIKKFCR